MNTRRWGEREDVEIPLSSVGEVLDLGVSLSFSVDVDVDVSYVHQGGDGDK